MSDQGEYRAYPDYRESKDEPWMFIREWEDQRLEEEFNYLSELLEVVASEIAFRAENSESDGTGQILVNDVELYKLSDRLSSYRMNFNRFRD